jgi:hypothetical protein
VFDHGTASSSYFVFETLDRFLKKIYPCIPVRISCARPCINFREGRNPHLARDQICLYFRPVRLLRNGRTHQCSISHYLIQIHARKFPGVSLIPYSPQSRIMRPERLILESGHTHPLHVIREHEAQRTLDPADGRFRACPTKFGIECVRS